MTPQDKLAPYKLTDRVLLEGLTDDFATRLYALMVDPRIEHRLNIVSAFRTYEQQTDLYNRWMNGTYDVPSVAKPGTSRHESGKAADLGIAWGTRYGWDHVHAVAADHGLHFPVRGEAWHAETTPGAAPVVEDYDMTPLEAQQLNDIHVWMSKQSKVNSLAESGDGITTLGQVVAAVQDTAKWTVDMLDDNTLDAIATAVAAKMPVSGDGLSWQELADAVKEGVKAALRDGVG